MFFCVVNPLYGGLYRGGLGRASIPFSTSTSTRYSLPPINLDVFIGGLTKRKKDHNMTTINTVKNRKDRVTIKDFIYSHTQILTIPEDHPKELEIDALSSCIEQSKFLIEYIRDEYGLDRKLANFALLASEQLTIGMNLIAHSEDSQALNNDEPIEDKDYFSISEALENGVIFDRDQLTGLMGFLSNIESTIKQSNHGAVNRLNMVVRITKEIENSVSLIKNTVLNKAE